MKIEGNTIIFKSTPENFYKEKEGIKPCTLRRITLWSEMKYFEMFYNRVKNRLVEDKTAKIIISCPEKHDFFEAILTDISQFEGLWLFSWNPGEKQNE